MNNSEDKNSFKYIIDGFRHESGLHCTSSALRDVFEFHGEKMSEAMIFGLGSGMSLGYLKIPRMEPFFGGRNNDFVKDLCSTLSITLTEYKTKNQSEGWQRLKHHLDKNIPSVINIDMGYLNYQKKNLPSEDYHFGGHTITVCGYDPQTHTVFVSDTHFSDILEISSEELSKGRNSTKDKFMAPNNLIYELDFPSKIPELATIIEDVLHRTGRNITSKSKRMFRLMGIHGGITAIEVLRKDLDGWLKQSAENLRFRCIQQAGYIGTEDHNYGTGGGLFRYLVAEFLEESALELNEKSLHNFAEFYEKLGEKWEKCALLFSHVGEDLEKSDKKPDFTKIKGILSELFVLEEEGAKKLLHYSL